jgi:hypothetical protein
MAFFIGNILLFKEYHFTDRYNKKKHFGLVILPETATKYQNSIYCCVITSQKPVIMRWSLLLKGSSYKCFRCDSYACLNKIDLESKNDLDTGPQPRANLNQEDLKKAYRKLIDFLYSRESGFDLWMRGAIVREWKKILNLE